MRANTFKVKRSKFLRSIAYGITASLLCGCMAFASSDVEETNNIAEGQVEAINDEEAICQVALLQSLMLGDYYGSISVGELKTMGDTGLGTFQDVNGEMIVLDGVVYQALSDGSIAVAADDVMVPFSDVTVFKADTAVEVNQEMDLNGLQELLNEKVAEFGENQFFMAKVEGDFPVMKVRSEYAQKEPYKPLAEVMKTDQVFFDYENVRGTVVALYCPDYMDGLNTPGWHYHFISEDKTQGGHVLGLTIANGQAELDATAGFEMILPTTDHFQELNLTTNLKDEIEAVEKN